MQKEGMRLFKTVCVFGAAATLITVSRIDPREFLLVLFSGVGCGLLYYVVDRYLLGRIQHMKNLFQVFFHTAIILVLFFVFNYLTGQAYSPLEYFLIFTVIMQAVSLRFVDRVLGSGTIRKYISGKYHHPIEENRIFMFIDVKDSTTIAEKIGPLKFHKLLSEFFNDVSKVMMQRQGEIYNYVGDEIIISWDEKRGLLDNNCIVSYFELRDKMHEKISVYYKTYGVFIDFKAGLHRGTVVTGEMGKYKKEIVFLGDTVNTASRIQSECNAQDKEILISKDLLKRLELPEDITTEEVGWIRLKGKENRVDLFTLKKKRKY